MVDLNLLTALDALLEDGTVAGAADRLGLSQPAMSRALGRIRRATGDQILVRTGRTMTPTPYAIAVRERVHALVDQSRAVLDPGRSLDLRTLERDFTLQGHDAILTVLGPILLAAVQREAPGVRLRLMAEAAVDTVELRHGRVDIAVGSEEADSPELRSERMGQDRLVVAMRSGHPLSAEPLTPATFAGATHLVVSRRGRLADPIDDTLAALGLRRRVVASVPTASAALQALLRTDLVVAVAERMCGPVIASLGLAVRPLPLDVADVPVVQSWHQRYDDDAGHAWLRDRVRAALRAVLTGDG